MPAIRKSKHEIGQPYALKRIEKQKTQNHRQLPRGQSIKKSGRRT